MKSIFEMSIDELASMQISKLNVKELKHYIRKFTEQANMHIQSITESGINSVALESEISELKTLGTGNIKRHYIGLGFTYKTKKELQNQARELLYFYDWDIESPEGKRALDERERKSWESFNSQYPEYTYDEWRKLVETFGAVGSEIRAKYSSASIAEINKEALDKGKNFNLTKTMLDILKDKDFKGANQKEILDELRRRILND